MEYRRVLLSARIVSGNLPQQSPSSYLLQIWNIEHSSIISCPLKFHIMSQLTSDKNYIPIDDQHVNSKHQTTRPIISQFLRFTKQVPSYLTSSQLTNQRIFSNHGECGKTCRNSLSSWKHLTTFLWEPVTMWGLSSLFINTRLFMIFSIIEKAIFSRETNDTSVFPCRYVQGRKVPLRLSILSDILEPQNILANLIF